MRHKKLSKNELEQLALWLMEAYTIETSDREINLIIRQFINLYEMNDHQRTLIFDWAEKIKDKLDDQSYIPLDDLNMKDFKNVRKKEDTSETAEDERRNELMVFMQEGIDFEKRVLYMDRPQVDDLLAQDTIKKLYVLEDLSQDPIYILMNSTGGGVYSGLAIYDVLKELKSPVYILIIGKCFSMATWILQAADKRCMLPNSKLMFHEGYMGLSSNHPQVNYNWADEYKQDSEKLRKILLERIREKNKGYKMETLKEQLDFDTILDAEEAVKMGLVDKVVKSLSEFMDIGTMPALE